MFGNSNFREEKNVLEEKEIEEAKLDVEKEQEVFQEEKTTEEVSKENIEVETEEEIEEKTESFGQNINNIQDGTNRTPRPDLALIVAGILFWLIGALLPGVFGMSGIFSFSGFICIVVGLYLLLKRILKAEQVVDNWGILIKKGNGKAEEIFILTEAFISDSKVPWVKIKRSQMSPGIIRGMLGTSRDFLVATDKNYRLSPYQIFINARDYGNNLDVSWYLTYRLPFWRALLRFIPGIGAASFTLESLDLFDRQDLTAYVTVCHYSTLEAVEKLMMTLNQDPSKIDRKSKGFLGIS